MARNPDHISRRKSSGIFVYMRRVPEAVSSIDKRKLIRESLATTDKATALALAKKLDAANEEYWASILQGLAPKNAWEKYEAAQSLVRAMGFQMRSTTDLLTVPLPELVARTNVAHAHLSDEDPIVVHAALGGASEPELFLDDLIEIYERNMQVVLRGLSENQRRKHMNARIRVVEQLKTVLGTKRPVTEFTAHDVQKYRDHWAARVLAGEVQADSAKREFTNVKGLFGAIDDELKTTISLIWKGLKIRTKGRKAKKRTRPPYPVDFVQQKLLAPGALDNLNLQARLIVYTMVETGLRLSEACNLRAEDIRLEAPIPHIAIQEREDRQQKTSHSIRTIPLVGVSLWALKQAPKGFSSYADKEDSASATINKFLREHGLRPTPRHTIYSLRHTFQDRLLDAGVPDRLQTDLMGHEFDREEYGAGSSMQLKLKTLESIKFRWVDPETRTGHHPTA